MATPEMALLILVSLLVFVFDKVSARENNIYSAIEHMKPLVDIEKGLIKIARTYLKEQKRKLSELAPFAKSVEEAMQLSDNDPVRYLGNPINCYLIIKRFTSGWKELPPRLDVDESSIKNIKHMLDANDLFMPSEVDMSGATAAMVRLMDNYNIAAHDIAEGKIGEVEPSTYQLTARDCMDIADICHKSQRYVRMKEWILEAERLINDPSIPHRHGNTTRTKVNGYLALSYYLDGDLLNALKYTEFVLKDEPKNVKSLENKEVYSWYIERNIPITLPETTYMKGAEQLLNIGRESAYVRICKKKVDVTGYKNIWNLRSYYWRGSPVLYLKPMRVTQLHDNPNIFILHNILTEQQMDKLKQIATPRLRVATVIDPFDKSQISVSKSMFLLPEFLADRKISEKLNPMFEAVSGLSAGPGEEIQINNYGLGGQYEGHHDYGEPGTLVANDEHGNRIATLHLYLSNVELGGETVFTELGLAVPPTEGSALFWYNLHHNGTGFHNTKHASCPVVSGSKWVANKWIREKGNEFRRPCTLNQFE